MLLIGNFGVISRSEAQTILLLITLTGKLIASCAKRKQHPNHDPQNHSSQNHKPNNTTKTNDQESTRTGLITPFDTDYTPSNPLTQKTAMNPQVA